MLTIEISNDTAKITRGCFVMGKYTDALVITPLHPKGEIKRVKINREPTLDIQLDENTIKTIPRIFQSRVNINPTTYHFLRQVVRY